MDKEIMPGLTVSEKEVKFLEDYQDNFKELMEFALEEPDVDGAAKEAMIAMWATMCLICLHKISGDRFDSLLPTILNNIDPSLNFNLTQGH